MGKLGVVSPAALVMLSFMMEPPAHAAPCFSHTPIQLHPLRGSAYLGFVKAYSALVAASSRCRSCCCCGLTVRTHVIATSAHERSCPFWAHLDPGGLDVGQRLLQRQPRNRMHKEALVQRRSLPCLSCTLPSQSAIKDKVHVHERQAHCQQAPIVGAVVNQQDLRWLPHTREHM